MGTGEAPPAHTIAEVGEPDLADLLGLLRAYCDFYRCAPSDAALLDLSRALLENPRLEGVQLIARDGEALAVGFATVFWSWDTTEASRIGIMNDLYVAPSDRGSGLADRLIAAALALCGERGAARLEWQTAHENSRAQAVYDRVGGVREPFIVFTKPAPRGAVRSSD
jgi:GNAT superfamily N-acetyltransferase